MDRTLLKGILLQKNNQIIGDQENNLEVNKLPFLIKPLKSFSHKIIKSTLNVNKQPNFILQDINFISKNCEKLFVFQNKNLDNWTLIENCTFKNEE